MRIAAGTHYRDITSHSSKGASDSYKTLVKEIMVIEHHLREAWAKVALSTVLRECSQENWDGYGALPVSEAAYSEAEKLLRLLPLDIPIPDVIPEPTGELAFEWRNRDRFFLLSVGGSNTISYAGIFDKGEGGKTHGTVRFRESLPDDIIERIRFLF